MFTEYDIARLKKGDETVYKRLYDESFYNLLSIASFYVDRDIAMDIVQEVYIHLFTHVDQIDKEKNILSYLKISVKNRCLNHLRSSRTFIQLDDCLHPSDKVDELRYEEDVYQLVEKAILHLPPTCHQVLKMSVYDGLRYEDIAERLSISKNTVKYHIKTAYKLLRKSLTSEQLFLYVNIYKSLQE